MIKKSHADIRKQFGIRFIRQWKFKATTNSKHNLPARGNLLQQNFNISNPDEVWVSDISYIDTGESWLYLADVKDLFSKEVVGTVMNSSLNKELVIKAMQQAIQRHRTKAGLISSMSSKGNCYDNVPAESLFGTIKTELVYLNLYETRAAAKQAIFEYVEVFNSRLRRHTGLGYLTTVEFKQRYFQEKQLEIDGSKGPARPGKALPLTAYTSLPC